MKTGDAVRITMNGRTVNGRIRLASTNGHSLMLVFDGALWTSTGGMYVMNMPVLRHPLDSTGTYGDLIAGDIVEIEVLP